MNVQKKIMSLFLGLCILMVGCSSNPNTDMKPESKEVKEAKEVNANKSPELAATPTKEVETSVNMEGNYIVLKIKYIGCIYFTAVAPWKSDAEYTVIAELGEEYCVGDYVQVTYDDIYEVEENQYEVYVKDVSAPNAVGDNNTDYKPVIYLYPKKEEHVSVKLDYRGTITVSSPEYKNNGWEVEAKPDGTLISDDGKKYPYIFWEGIREMAFDMTEGFCIKGQETETFLKEKLQFMGLTEKETMEFINFWLPYMKGNPYNLISFQGEAYTDYAKLTITPKPDSILRVYMVFKPLKKKMNITEQKLKTFKRHGFTVVEWGGTIQ